METGEGLASQYSLKRTMTQACIYWKGRWGERERERERERESYYAAFYVYIPPCIYWRGGGGERQGKREGEREREVFCMSEYA